MPKRMFLAFSLALLIAAIASPAQATFGGRAGRITFAREVSDAGNLEVFSAKKDGKDVQRLTFSGDERTSFFTDWSPDGNTIAFDSDRIDQDGRDDVVQIYTMPWNGEAHGLTQLTVGPGFHGDPGYSPDGNWIAIESDWGDYPASQGIWIIPSSDPDGVTQAEAIAVTTTPGDGWVDTEPQFSPDGAWIAFTRIDFINEKQAIYKVRIDGSGMRRLTDFKGQNSAPDWSPDGSMIAFDSNDFGEVGARGDIWVMRADGSHKKRLTHNPKVTDTKFVLANNPVWAPDGKRILFTQWQRDGAVQMVSIKPDGSGQKLMVRGDQFQNKADWARTGSRFGALTASCPGPRSDVTPGRGSSCPRTPGGQPMPDMDEALRTQIRNIETTSGRSMDEWTALVAATGLKKHGEIVAWLKSEQGMTHGNANLVALTYLRGPDAPEGDALVDAIYAGPKATLRPLHDRVIKTAEGFGGDVALAPKQAYVSVRRAKQFATVGPASGGRLEVGFNLKDVEPAGRLERASGMCTHRVRLTDPSEFDDEVVGWLRSAYDGAG